MPTIIDALIVTLGLDPAGYQKGADQADQAGKKLATGQEANAKKITESSKKASDAQIAQAKKQEEAAKKLAEQYGKVKLELLDMAAGTLAATGLGKMIGSTVSGLSQLQTQSQLLGYSANEIAKWQNVVKNLGGDPGEFNQFAARLAKFRSDIKLGRQDEDDARFQASMQMMRVSDDALMRGSFQDIFSQMAERTKGMQNADIANLVGNTPALGLGVGMIQLIQSGAAGIAKSYQNAAGANDEAAKDAKGLDKAYQDLKTKIETSLQNFPGFDTAMKDATKGLEAIGKLASEHPTGTAVGVGGSVVGGGIATWLLGRSAAAKFFRMFVGAGEGAAAAGAGGAGAVAGEGAAATAGGAGALLSIAGVAAAGAGGYFTGSLLRDPVNNAIKSLSGGKYGQLWDIFTGTDRSKLGATGGYTQAELDSVKSGGGVKLSTSSQKALKAAEAQNHASDKSKAAAGDLSDAAKAQREASKALVDAAKDLASALSTNANAAEMPSVGSVAPGNVKQAVAAFMQMGWTKEQASGIAANLNVESGLRPNISGDNGAAYGIGQWHADRQAEFRRVFGHDIRGSSLAEQLQFVNYELTKGQEQSAGRALRRATTAGEAGSIISSRYERPLKVEEEKAKRSAAANSLYASLGGGASLAPMYAAGARAQAGSATTNHNTSETHIGTVNVYGSNTNDGRAVASDMRDQINQHALIANSAIPVT